jgi:hypothetical protein
MKIEHKEKNSTMTWYSNTQDGGLEKNTHIIDFELLFIHFMKLQIWYIKIPGVNSYMWIWAPRHQRISLFSRFHFYFVGLIKFHSFSTKVERITLYKTSDEIEFRLPIEYNSNEKEHMIKLLSLQTYFLFHFNPNTNFEYPFIKNPFTCTSNIYLLRLFMQFDRLFSYTI